MPGGGIQHKVFMQPWSIQPGSSLPSGQSQESSLTKSHDISLDPSKHVQVPDFEGVYFGSKSGETPRVFEGPAVADSGRDASRISQGTMTSVQPRTPTCLPALMNRAVINYVITAKQSTRSLFDHQTHNCLLIDGHSNYGEHTFTLFFTQERSMGALLGV